MVDKPDNPFQFWQELKRRKVIRVIPVYAAAAFILLELVDIIAEPLGLPGWTINFVLVLLCIGFIIAVILSWVYDITPDGVQKTKSAKEIDEAQKLPTSNIWKVISFVSVVIIVAFVVFYIVGNIKQSSDISKLEKSIAVLPFINDSPDEENTYFINGIMEEVLLNLQAIKDLRVPGRTSVEQYRNPTKSIPEIAKELDVNYIVEGSGQKYGNTIRLRIQLIDGTKDRHLWGESYEQEIESPEVIFRIQSQIAESIAAEVKAIITPEEKQVIEKTPTTNLTAYEFYQKGREEYIKYWLDYENVEALENAADLFQYALEYDSTYAQVYAGLAMIQHSKNVAAGSYSSIYSDTYLESPTFDSVLHLANLALSFDSQLAEAHVVKGNCFREIGQRDRAEIEFNKAIVLNPNSWEAYYGIGELYFLIDNLKSLIHYHQAASLHHGSELSFILDRILQLYFFTGLFEEAKFYNKEVNKLKGDSLTFYFYSYATEASSGNFDKAKKFLNYAYAIDSTNIGVLQNMGLNYMFLGQHKESLLYLKKYFDQLKKLGGNDINNMHRIGYAYWREGNFAEADYYFDKQIEACKGLIELDRPQAQNANAYYDLAGVYAFRGEKDKAYENLEIFNQNTSAFSGIINLIRNDPLFQSIRDEPEFQQIIRDVEAKYQAEHERVRKWLEENDML